MSRLDNMTGTYLKGWSALVRLVVFVSFLQGSVPEIPSMQILRLHHILKSHLLFTLNIPHTKKPAQQKPPNIMGIPLKMERPQD